MAVTKDFKDAVNNNQKTKIRIMLKNSMIIDPSLKTFDEMLAYAEKNLPDIYDEHNGEELINDSSAWDEQYMNQQMVVLVTNFSKERIDLLRKIVKKLYAHRIKNETSDAIKSSRKPTGVQIAGGVIAVIAAIVALIGGIVESSIPVIAGGAALIGGIAMIAFGRNKEA